VDESETGSANLFGPAAKPPVRAADQWRGLGGTGTLHDRNAARQERCFSTPGTAASHTGNRRFSTIPRVPHLRPPSIDRGVAAFLWAAGFGLFIYFGLVAVTVDGVIAGILAALAFGAIFLFVRIFGENEPRRQQARSRGTPR
jgi:hypothetical protein